MTLILSTVLRLTVLAINDLKLNQHKGMFQLASIDTLNSSNILNFRKRLHSSYILQYLRKAVIDCVLISLLQVWVGKDASGMFNHPYMRQSVAVTFRKDPWTSEGMWQYIALARTASNCTEHQKTACNYQLDVRAYKLSIDNTCQFSLCIMQTQKTTLHLTNPVMRPDGAGITRTTMMVIRTLPAQKEAMRARQKRRGPPGMCICVIHCT